MAYSRDESEVRRCLARGLSVRASARSAGASRKFARRVHRDWTDERVVKPGPTTPRNEGQEPPIIVEETHEHRVVEFDSDIPVETMEEAVALSGADMTVWRVSRWGVGHWTTAMKLRVVEGGVRQTDRPIRKNNFRIWVKFDRIISSPVEDAARAVATIMGAYDPPGYDFPVLYIPKDAHLLVMGLVDAHFGKYAWAGDSGQNDDLKIKETIWRDAVAEFMGRSAGLPIREFLVPVGSDFFHFDTAARTTTKGTPVDSDGRLGKVIKSGMKSFVWAIEEMGKAGNVRLCYVPGNHDHLTSYCLTLMLSAWFRDHKRVTVDDGATPRKYHKFKRTLIGMTHGDEEKHSVLPTLMAVEAPAALGDPAVFGNANSREWLTGHFHKAKQLAFLPLDENGGVTVRVLPSLSGTDAWHYRRGFVGSRRSAEAWLYDSHGLVGSYVANVRGTP